MFHVRTNLYENKLVGTLIDDEFTYSCSQDVRRGLDFVSTVSSWKYSVEGSLLALYISEFARRFKRLFVPALRHIYEVDGYILQVTNDPKFHPCWVNLPNFQYSVLQEGFVL
jgi:hypothetical protein